MTYKRRPLRKICHSFIIFDSYILSHVFSYRNVPQQAKKGAKYSADIAQIRRLHRTFTVRTRHIGAQKKLQTESRRASSGEWLSMLIYVDKVEIYIQRPFLHDAAHLDR